MKLILLVLLGLPLLVGVFLALSLGTSPAKAAASIPLPIPVYSIVADGGPNYSHHASLLNLNLGQPGVPQVPIPVDTDGDLLPDVTVAVNLINVDGAFLNPPQLGQIIAPNIQINRMITAPILGQKAYPLRISVKVTVKDVGSSNPDTTATFGYDTGPGGSIPPFWKATVSGLQNFFNPVQALIDTTGQELGLHPGISDFRLGPVAAPYQGPLKIIGGVSTPSLTGDFTIAYRPFPNAIQLSYGTDSQGQHINYSHGVDTEVDMTTTAKLTTPTGTTDAVARIDRLPRSMSIDFNQSTTGGSVDFHSVPNNRLPDASVDLTTTSAGSAPLVAHADIESLPASMHGEWNITAGQPGHVAFNASGTGVGAIEARVANFAGLPTKLVPWVPDQQQYASFQNVTLAGGATEQLIMGRAERLRNMSFNQVGTGYSGHVGIGDGELPFVANIGLNDAVTGGSVINARAQISPLPDSIDMAFSPPGTDQSVNPLRVSYDASQSVDVDAHVEIRQAGAAANSACGASKTICADFAGRDIPAHLEARVIDGLHTPQGQPETRIELDDIPRPGGIQPDFKAHVVIGQNDLAPLIADANLDGLSRFIRVRAVQGLDETLQRLEFHTCDYDYATFACAPGSEDEVGAVGIDVRNFVTRPANLPAVASPAPLFAGVVSRGDATNPDLVRFEAKAQMSHIKEFQYANAGGTFGVRTRIGGGKNLAVDVDVKNIALPQFPNNHVDLEAHALITPLPDTINLCVQNSGGPLVAGSDPLTAACQKLDPFGDGTAAVAPITFDWDASSAFSVKSSARIHFDEGTSTPTDDVAASANIHVDNIPGKLHAVVAVPDATLGGPVRVLTQGTAGSNINVGVQGGYTVGGASCDDPAPSHDVACADVSITGLPTNTSMLIDGTKNASRVEFHACDFQFYATTPTCRAGTVGQIGVIAVDGHLVQGNPGALNVLEPTTDQYAFLQARQPSSDDIALRARVRLEAIRNVTYRQTADGYDATYDMGSGAKPLEAKVQADTRNGTSATSTGLQASAEVLITPLPAQISIGLHGPGDGNGAAPMKVHYDASTPIRVQAHAQVFSAATGANPSCGDNGTACATLDIQRVPAHMSVAIGQTETAGTGGSVDHHSIIDVATDAPVGAKPDVIVDAIAGLPTTTPLVGSVPVRAHLDLLGLPRFVTAHIDEHVTKPGAADELRDLQKVSVRTCQLTNTDTCVPGTEDQLDTFSLLAQDFLSRPLNFPAPNAGITQPMWATVYGRGSQFQVAVKLKDIRELTYINHTANATKGFRV
ncbi:MAG: hypothetical protein ABI232_01435, partial [Jatrophihabitantaceae bacterium]